MNISGRRLASAQEISDLLVSIHDAFHTNV